MRPKSCKSAFPSAASAATETLPATSPSFRPGGISPRAPASNGILAQSIGGGGGIGGNANTVSLQHRDLVHVRNAGAAKDQRLRNSEEAEHHRSSRRRRRGRHGRQRRHGDVTNNSFITTTGSASSGIVAQSIGGGGGNGGQAIVGLDGLFTGANYAGYVAEATGVSSAPARRPTVSARSPSAASAARRATAATVTVTNFGAITLRRTRSSPRLRQSSNGIQAQSIGGGGGDGGEAKSGSDGRSEHRRVRRGERQGRRRHSRQ